MNEVSSRSHAVFTLVLTQRLKDEATSLETEKVFLFPISLFFWFPKTQAPQNAGQQNQFG
jgi:hypothetical protein